MTSALSIARAGLYATLAFALAAGPPARAQCEIQELTAAAAAATDQFGDAVAISGDLAVVGASRHDLYGSASGIAYVFRFDGLEWIQEAELYAFASDLAPDGATNDLFGAAVAIDAFATAGPVVVVGAPLDDDGFDDSGSAYVFRWNGAAWTPEQKLNPGDAADDDQFASAVAVRGDLVIAGASRADAAAGENAGAAYAFRRVGAGWGAGVRLEAPDAAAGDRFGIDVALSAGDAGGDVVIVGAALRDGATSNHGGAYVFRHDGAAWDAGVLLIASGGGGLGDNFGQAVAVDGDLAIVGAPFNDDVDENAGAAYVFRRKGGVWDAGTQVVATSPGESDRLGTTVAILADPDGAGDLAIAGAPLADAAAITAGRVHLYRYTGVWEPAGEIVASDGAANDQFGGALSAAAAGILVGANKADDAGSGMNSGAAYLFSTIDDDCADCDDDGLFDVFEIELDPALDCNANGVLDVCEIDANGDASGGPYYCVIDCDPDCNANGLPDACDIDGGGSNDADANDIPDECEDCDENGQPDALDLENGDAFDCNGNGVLDVCDIADGLEEDCDGDGVPDPCAIADDPNRDLDGNGVIDSCEDCDGNGVPDFIEIASNPGLDCDANDILDVCEIDQDGDAPGGPYYCTSDCDPDCNANGIPDECDVADGASEDIDADGVPDECQDCNGNGVLDSMDVGDETSPDCNANGIPDECDVTDGTSPDCNDNGIPDTCDTADETSDDCDGNAIPDECEDCDGNGVGDACDIENDPNRDLDGNGVLDACDPDCDDDGLSDFVEIVLGTAEDCNENGVPDACEIPAGSDAPGGPFYCTAGCDPDCNDNGVPDDCDIANGTSEDADGNGRPDECPPPACPADFDGSGAVDFQDLLALLFAWGPCAGCPEDLTADGAVGFQDLLEVLFAWGPC